MSDDGDYNIESADAGASATIPMEAGQIKKGGYVSADLLLCLFDAWMGVPMTMVDPSRLIWHKLTMLPLSVAGIICVNSM